MKKILCILLLMSTGIHFLNAQSSVAIGDSNPKASAVLYLKGNGSQGFIIPIVSNTTSISNPEAGMIVYNSGDKNVYYHNGSAWTVIGSVSGGGSTPTLSNGQLLTGNGTTNGASTLAGDATLSGGTITISNNAITSAKIADGTIAASDLNAMSATNGQVLKFNGTTWAPAADAGGVTYTGGAGITIAGTVITNAGDTNASDDITTASTAAGDVTGLFSNLQIASGAVTTTEIADGTIAAADLNSMSATNGQILKYNGTSWVPSTDNVGGGATPTLSNGQLLTGNGTSNAASTLAGDATLSGGTITISNNAITSTKIADGTIAAVDLNPMSATNGQVLKFNGTNWAPAAEAGTVYTGGTGISVAGTVITNSGDTNATDDLTTASTAAGDVTGLFSNLQLASGSVGATEIADGSITGADLANNLAIATTGSISVNSPGIISGSGSGITAINAGNISSGSLAIVRIAPSGTNGDVLTTVGGLPTWQAPVTGATTLDGLTDATLSVPTTGQILVNDGAGQFRNVSMSLDATISSAGALMLTAGSVSGGTGGKIADASITSADLAVASVTGGTGGIIADASITNADVSATAAIAGTKIAPSFGAQDISTTGTIQTGQFIGNTAIINDALVTMHNTATTGNSNGVFGETDSPAGAGVFGNSVVGGTGVIGFSNTNKGVAGFSTTGIGVYGQASGIQAGTYGYNDGTGPGVVGVATGTGQAGVSGTSDAIGGRGIYGSSINGQAGYFNGSLVVTGAIGLSSTPNYGVAGQVLTSAGPGVTPTWGTVSGVALATNNVIPKGNGTTQVASQLFDNGTNVGIGTVTPVKKLDINGDLNFSTGSSIFVNNVRMFNATSTNTSLGSNAGIATTGGANTFLGFDAGKGNTTGTYNLHVGRGAGANSQSASYNVIVGADAGSSLVTGGLNTMVGFNAGFNSDGAISNTFIGNKAGLGNTTADFNTFIGERSAEFNETGAENTFVGRTTGAANITGQKNTLIGTNANVGSDALQNATAIGYGAIVSVSNSMVLGGTGASAVNVGIGTSTPHASIQLASTVANRKIVLYEATNNDHQFIGFGVEGSGALKYQTAANGNDHIFYSGINPTTSSELMRIKGTGGVGIGTGAPTSTLSVNGSADKAGGGNWGTFSDRRVKKDILSFTDGLEVLMKFKPVQFKYNGMGGYSEDGKSYVGVIAQDVLPVAPYMISSVRRKLSDSDLNETDILKYDGSALTYVLVNSVKEQQAEIEELKMVIQVLEAKLKKYESDENAELAIIREQIKKLSEAVGMEASLDKKK